MKIDYYSLPLFDRILSDAVDDYLHLGSIFGCLEEYAVREPGVACKIAGGVIASLLLDELVVIGNLEDDGVVPWSGTRDAIISRMLDLLPRAYDDDLVAHQTWLDLTPKGELRVSSWS